MLNKIPNVICAHNCYYRPAFFPLSALDQIQLFLKTRKRKMPRPQTHFGVSVHYKPKTYNRTQSEYGQHQDVFGHHQSSNTYWMGKRAISWEKKTGNTLYANIMLFIVCVFFTWNETQTRLRGSL